MAETQSAPSLREWEVDLETLNKAATPGRWLFEHMQGVKFAGLYSDDATGSIIAKFGGFEFAPRPDAETDANCALAVILVNSYREGRMARAADAEHYMRLAGTWKRVAERAGVCMTCALGAPDISIGCTDCLNTGWEHGAPDGLVREEVMAEAVAAARAETEREREALKLAMQFLDRCVGEGIGFVKDDTYPEADAMDVACAIAEKLGIDVQSDAFASLVAYPAPPTTPGGRTDG